MVDVIKLLCTLSREDDFVPIISKRFIYYQFNFF